MAIELDRTVEAVIFDWDGTAVPDRGADATDVRARVEALCAVGVHVVVVSGTHVDNIDAQLTARPDGPGSLHLCLNRGSEVFEVTRAGVALLAQRVATADEEVALDRSAAMIVTCLREVGLDAEVVSRRLNRRKIDLLPEPAWVDPPKARIAELLEAVEHRLAAAGLGTIADVVALATRAASDAGLADPRITSDVKHVEVGLTDKSESARWAERWLGERGITGELVLVAGDEFGPVGGVAGSDSLLLVPELARALAVSVGVEPGGVPVGIRHLGGGPATLLALLDEQLTRRADLRVPAIDHDPAWVVPLPDNQGMERAAEAIGALGNGWVGTRASRDEDGPGTQPLLAVGGVYDDGDPPRLLAAPVWTAVGVAPTGPTTRTLDLRTGVLAREGGGVRSVRFVSAARPEAMALRIEADADQLAPGPVLAGAAGAACEHRVGEVAELARCSAGTASITVAARDRQGRTAPGVRTVDRLAAWVAGGAGAAGWADAEARLAELELEGFDRLLAAHRAAWARHWADAAVRIDGDDGDELLARFAVFHLLAAAHDRGEAAVGARGLTGPAYGGHVFWDADVFVLPAIVAIRPGAARAMLEYRIRRLPAARMAAAELGRQGARFPWESADEGVDVTPRHVRGQLGELVPVRTGVHEEHIVADVAWAAAHYSAWTGDEAFLDGPGRPLLEDTAAYWADRIRLDAAGRGHLDGVMGPDEYHEVVDDDVFTNLMARWNLREAARRADAAGDGRARQWRALADALVDGWDPARAMYEQFAGYWELEPLFIADVAEPPVAADVLLGPARVAGSQLIKQPDVLMAHHLIPAEVEPGSLAANLAFYEPRTAHGSSLSPAVCASLYARAGDPERALALFRLAARLDLDDLTGTTAAGLHLATMGGVWQALAHGFLGLRPEGDSLAIDPCLPAVWRSLGLRCRFRGRSVEITARHDQVAVACAEPVHVRVAGEPPVACLPPGQTFDLHGGAG